MPHPYEDTAFCPSGVTLVGSGKGSGSYKLPPATALVLGGVKAGDNIVIHPDGTVDAVFPGALTFKGTVDATVAKTAGYVPKAGDTWVVTKAGTAHTDWNGLTNIVKDSLIIYDGKKWDIAGDLGTNVKPDWDAASGAATEILNKPTSILKYWGVADTGADATAAYTASAGGKVPTVGDVWQTSKEGTADSSWAGLTATHPNDLVVFDGVNWTTIARVGGTTRYYGISDIPSGDPNDGVGTVAPKTPVVGLPNDAVLTDKALWKWDGASTSWVKSFDLAGSGGALPSRNWTMGASMTTKATTPLAFSKTFQAGAAPYAVLVTVPTGGDLGNMTVKNSVGEIVASARGVVAGFHRLDVEPDSILPNGTLTVETTKAGTFDFTVAALVKDAALPPGTPPPPGAPPPTGADAVPYDNTASALTGTDVQAVVDELAARKPDWDAASGAADEILHKPEVPLNFLGDVSLAVSVTDIFSGLARSPRIGDCFGVSSSLTIDPSWTGITSANVGDVLSFNGSNWDKFVSAAVPVKPDWNAAAGTAAEILNKPKTPPADDIDFDSSSSAMTATSVQDAIEQVWMRIPDWDAGPGSPSRILNKPTIVVAPPVLRQIHVETAGNDATADGTAAKPFKTIEAALVYLSDSTDGQGADVTISKVKVGAGTFTSPHFNKFPGMAIYIEGAKPLYASPAAMALNSKSTRTEIASQATAEAAAIRSDTAATLWNGDVKCEYGQSVTLSSLAITKNSVRIESKYGAEINIGGSLIVNDSMTNLRLQSGSIYSTCGIVCGTFVVTATDNSYGRLSGKTVFESARLQITQSILHASVTACANFSGSRATDGGQLIVVGKGSYAFTTADLKTMLPNYNRVSSAGYVGNGKISDEEFHGGAWS